MARWFSNGLPTRSGKWKWLVASVLAAGAIGLSCGLCESSTKAACMQMLTAIASSLSPIDQKTNAVPASSPMDTMSLTTIRSTTITSETSLNDSVDTFLNPYATFTVANMGTKISDRTTMPVSLMFHSTIRSSINKEKALLLTHRQLCRNSGLMDSQRWANSTTIRQLIPLAIYSKKSQDPTHSRRISEMMNTALRTGSNLHTVRCP